VILLTGGEIMDEKYMNKYIELSKALNETNKSQKIIDEIYAFLNELVKEENTDNEIMLSYVYTLLGYHQKAYDIYKKIYDENEAKAKAKLLKLEQMAQSSGDKFPLRINTKGGTI
jgi:phage/plasmid-associated DNA primase